jgi:hypothetical protein
MSLRPVVDKRAAITLDTLFFLARRVASAKTKGFNKDLAVPQSSNPCVLVEAGGDPVVNAPCHVRSAADPGGHG